MPEDFVYPDFTNSLVNIPQSLLAHFGLSHSRPTLSYLLEALHGQQKVILFVADGLGYNLWAEQNANENHLYQKLRPHTKKITSVFPTSTPPALTTLSTGLTPLEHGLLDWNVYFRELDAIIETLPYRGAVDDRVELSSRDPNILFDGTTIYERLATVGVRSFYFVTSPYHLSVYTQAISKGATVSPYVSMDDLLLKLKGIVEKTEGLVYCYVHWAGIDTAEHAYGPAASGTRQSIEFMSRSLDEGFFGKLERRAAKTATFIFTADHGQVSVLPDKAIYLNQYDALQKGFKKSISGKPILPTGGARDLFLNMDEGHIEQAADFLRTALGDAAFVGKLDKDTLPQLYGQGTPHSEFVNRSGNILVLPKSTNSIWYKYASDKPLTEYGDHGGLSSDELFVPLAAFRIADILS